MLLFVQCDEIRPNGRAILCSGRADIKASHVTESEITNQNPEPKKIGRPRKFTPELAERLCAIVATTNSGLRRIVEDNPELPCQETVYSWIRTNPEFLAQYARAKQLQLQVIEDDILGIADDGRNDWMTIDGKHVVNREAVQRSQLRIDARKWLMSKLLPKKYGEKLDMNLTGEISLAERLSKARQRVSK